MRSTDPRTRGTALPFALPLALTMLVLAGCASPQPLPLPTASPSASLGPIGDGVLRIGTLVPLRGDVSALGPAMIAAVETAVRDVNAAGGVLGVPVETVHRPSGRAGDDTLESSFAELLEREVDVIVGPTDTTLAERLAPLAAEAGILVIAPAAIAPVATSEHAAVDPAGDAPVEELLGDAADLEPSSETPAPLMIALLPDPALQAAALVADVAASGATTLAVLGSADAASRGLVAAVRSAAHDAGIRVTAVEQLDERSTINRLAFSLTAGAPEALVVATASSLVEAMRPLLVELGERGIDGAAIRFAAASTSDHEGELPEGLLDGALGIREGAAVDDAFAARLRQSDPFVRGTRLAPEAYDAVVLAALAATLAGADGGTRVAARVVEVASEGIPCLSFGACLAVLEDDREIDYDGLSGTVTMDARGILLAGSWSLLRYDAAGAAKVEGVLDAPAP